MELTSYFTDFLRNIRPTDDDVDDYKRGHKTLRKRLNEDKKLSPIIVSTFLQGSYRRATAIRPQGGTRADVDVVVVTRLSEQDYPNPGDAMDEFTDFLNEHYKGRWKANGRSFALELNYVDLDLVITSAPSESETGILKSDSVTTDDTLEETEDWRLVKSWIAPENRTSAKALQFMTRAKSEAEWQSEPLHIPDRDAKRWEPTHPLKQIHWTWDKNSGCNKHYVNVVKALKWWRRVKHPGTKYPKGYPLEHLVGLCCPDGVESIAEGVTLALEKITADYGRFAANKTTPFIPDHGVPSHNVFARVSGEDFAVFYDQVADAAEIARRAFDNNDPRESALEWKKLFGDEFPDPPASGKDDDKGRGGPTTAGYTPRKEPTSITGGRFA